jgi:hypothetical protein
MSLLLRDLFHLPRELYIVHKHNKEMPHFEALLGSKVSSYVCGILRIIDGTWMNVDGIWKNINRIVMNIDGTFKSVSRTLRSVSKAFRSASMEFLKVLAYIIEHHHLVIHKFWWMHLSS